MENKGVLVGSIVFVFGAFILMISLLVYESYKAKQMKALALIDQDRGSTCADQRAIAGLFHV